MTLIVILFLVKQARLSLPGKTNCTELAFALIHMDIWGPYNIPTHMEPIVDD